MPGKAGTRGGLVAMLVAFLLAACAAPTPLVPTASPLPTPSPTTPPPTPTPTVPAPGPLVVTLTLWVPEELSPYGEEPSAAVLAQQLADFSHTYPDLQVEVIVKEAHGRGGLLDLLRTASVAAPSVLPDLVMLDTAELRVAAQAGLLQPLDGFLPAGFAADRFPFAAELGDVDGQTMGVVVAAKLQHLAYRPALFASPPLTWTAVVSAPAPFVFPAAGQDGDVNDTTLIQYLAAGGRLTDGEGNPQLEAGPLTDVLAFYEQGVAAGVISPTVVLSLSGVEGCWEVFQNWEAGMTVVDSRRFWTGLDPQAAFALLPTQDGRTLTLAEGWAVGLVTSDPDRQQLAAMLLEWLLAAEHSGPWTQSGAYLPGTLSGLQEWTVAEEERALLEALLEGAMPPPDPAVRAAVGPPLQAALKAVLESRRTPADAAADAVRAVGP